MRLSGNVSLYCQKSLQIIVENSRISKQILGHMKKRVAYA